MMACPPMSRRRALLLPEDATNEGSRRLRKLLRRHSFAAIGRRLRCDERTVRRLAREEGKPSLLIRARGREVLGISELAWDEAPWSDIYAGSEPPTMRAAWIARGDTGGPPARSACAPFPGYEPNGR